MWQVLPSVGDKNAFAGICTFHEVCEWLFGWCIYQCWRCSCGLGADGAIPPYACPFPPSTLPFLFLVCFTFHFYPRSARDARAIIVCLCVTRRYCIKTSKCVIMQTTPRDSPGILVFWRQNLLMEDPTLFPLKFVLNVTHPLDLLSWPSG